MSYAQSLDGSLAAERGRPLRLSGEQSMALTHALRASHDAILVGSGTLLSDDPRLIAKNSPGPQPQPVVLDSSLRTPPTALVLAHPRRAWIAACLPLDAARQAALEAAGARILALLPAPQGGVSLPALLQRLAQDGIHSLMVEGGARAVYSFLAEGLADQFIVTIAPIFVGGLPAVGQPFPTGSFPRLVDTGSAWYGPDLVVWGRFTPQSP